MDQAHSFEGAQKLEGILGCLLRGHVVCIAKLLYDLAHTGSTVEALPNLCSYLVEGANRIQIDYAAFDGHYDCLAGYRAADKFAVSDEARA